MNTIPPFDASQQYQSIAEEANAAVLALLASGRYIGGAAVADFEAAFARYHGVDRGVACNSGTDALYLALRALGVGPGDEVITTPFTFIATAEAISAVGASPVFADIDPTSFNLDPDAVAAAVTPRTRAIVPVHLFGHPADLTRLMAIAAERGLWVVEDCAQSTGATWGDRKTGSFGHVSCFSFYPTKNLGACGDGGAVLTNDPAIADRVRMLREHGSRQRYCHEAIGTNSRLDAIQAALLSIKLQHLDRWNAARTAIAERYAALLAGLPGVTLPGPAIGGGSVWNQYTIRIAEDADGDAPTAQRDGPDGAGNGGGNGAGNGAIACPAPEETRRDRLRAALQARGVGTAVYYPIPLHRQPVYAHLGYGPGSLPEAERAAREVLSLPMFPELSADAQARVAIALKESLATLADPAAIVS